MRISDWSSDVCSSDLEGLTEADVCIGDVYRLGSARVEVSQARQPCWRLNERFETVGMARRVQETGRTGWYYRVLEEGRVGPGGTLDLLDRPAGDWTLERILHVLYPDTHNVDGLGPLELGRATGRERVCQYVKISVVAVSLKKKKT